MPKPATQIGTNGACGSCVASSSAPSQRICAGDSGATRSRACATRLGREPAFIEMCSGSSASAVSAARRCSRPWPAGSAIPGAVQRERARRALGGEHPGGEARDPLPRRRARAAARATRGPRDRRRRRPRTAWCASRRRARPPSRRRAAAGRPAGRSRSPARSASPSRRVAVRVVAVATGGQRRRVGFGRRKHDAGEGKVDVGPAAPQSERKVRRQRDAAERDATAPRRRNFERHRQRRVRDDVDGHAGRCRRAASVIALRARRAARERQRERQRAAGERLAGGERAQARCRRGCETCAAAPPRRRPASRNVTAKPSDSA